VTRQPRKKGLTGEMNLDDPSLGGSCASIYGLVRRGESPANSELKNTQQESQREREDISAAGEILKEAQWAWFSQGPVFE